MTKKGCKLSWTVRFLLLGTSMFSFLSLFPSIGLSSTWYIWMGDHYEVIRQNDGDNARLNCRTGYGGECEVCGSCHGARPVTKKDNIELARAHRTVNFPKVEYKLKPGQELKWETGHLTLKGDSIILIRPDQKAEGTKTFTKGSMILKGKDNQPILLYVAHPLCQCK